MLKEIFPFVAPLVTSLLVVYLGFRLNTSRHSLTKYANEKWWDEKRQTYAKIVEALALMKAHAIYYLDYTIHVEKEDEKSEMLGLASKDSRMMIEKVTATGAYIISDEVEEHLKTLQKERNAARGADSIYDHVDMEIVALEKCIKAIKACTKKELGVN